MLKKIDQEELIPILKETGIVAKEYSNPRAVGTPIEFFLSTIPGGKGILIKKGEKIGLKIATDKKHRQAVLSVHEGKRKITRVVRFTEEFWEGDEPTDYDLERVAKDIFNMAIPGAKVAVSGIKKVKTETTYKATHADQKNKFKVYYQATVTAGVNKQSTNHFLMGMDETSHFIAILPKKVKVESVKAAHKFLKPHGVGAGSKRQGEFFFVPVRGEIGNFVGRTVFHGLPLERGSAHHAQYGIAKDDRDHRQNSRYSGAQYVKGLIWDRRGYRHAPVDLGNKWHKVMRNREVQTTLNPSRRVTRYD